LAVEAMRKFIQPFLAFVAALTGFRFVTRQLGVVDDAWITYAYARNLARGHGICFNPGEHVEGCTAFLHMVLLAPFTFFVERLDIVALVINVAAWSAVTLIAWDLIRERGGKPVGVLGYFAAAFILMGFSGSAWTYSGMEMPLVGLAWLGAARLHLWEREHGKLPIASALVTVAAGLLRPDGILVAITLALSTWVDNDRRLQWKKAITYSAIVLGLFGGYWLWRWSYFGYFLPNTFYAKVTHTSLSLTMSGVKYLARWFFGMGVPLLGTVAMIYAWGRRPLPRWVVVLMGLVGTSIGYVLLVGGDFFSFHRYLVPSYAPMVLVAWWFGVGALAKRREVGDKKLRSRPARIVLAVVAFAVLQLVYFVGRVPPQGLVHGFIVENTQDWALVAKQLRKYTPEGAEIATLPIGAMGYFSHRYILDLVGLTDTHIAHAQVPTGVAITGHEKYDIDYVMQRSPELIFTWPGAMPPEPEGLVKWTLSNIGAQAQKKLMTDPRTRAKYQLVWLLLEEEKIPIRRGSLERWQAIRQGKWNGETMAKGVIGLIRRDLLGSEAYASFVPMGEKQADWLWNAFEAGTYEEMLEQMRSVPQAQPGPKPPAN
jgi:arabinofuranosyltransferase